MFWLKAPLAAILSMAVSLVWAQAQIVESQPIGGGRGSTTAPAVSNPTPALDPSVQMELYFQLQILQQEVQELRGIIEQQGFELRQLKQQRMDDYLDLDRRIGQMQPAGSGSAPAVPSRPATAMPPVSAPAAATAQPNELAAYRAAIDLVLKQRDFDAGATALEAYLADFPTGSYRGNALYWLGQIYLQKNELAQSRQWFSQLLSQFPEHQKAAEAKYKLGRVYHGLGDSAQAKKLLEEVAASGTTEAALARDYLQQHF